MSPARRRGALAALCLCAFAVNLDVTMVNVTLPTLVDELHADTSRLQWIVDAYTLVFASLVLVGGSLGDRLGRRGMLLAGLAVYALGNGLAGLADSSGQLIALRGLMGLGAAMIFPTTLSLISNVFPERTARAKAIGVVGRRHRAGRRARSDRGRRADRGVLLAGDLPREGAAGRRGVAAVLAVVPTSRDPRAERLDLPGFGLRTLPVALAIAVGSTLGAQVALRRGAKLVVACGLLLYGTAYAWISTLEAHTGYGAIAGQMVLLGAGMGLTSAPATEAIMGAVGLQRAGVGSAINDASRELGSTLGVAVLGSIYASLYAHAISAAAGTANVPARALGAARESVGAAEALAGRLADGGAQSAAGALRSAATGGFLDGLQAACLVACGVCVLGALACAWLLPAHPADAAAEAGLDPAAVLVATS